MNGFSTTSPADDENQLKMALLCVEQGRFSAALSLLQPLKSTGGADALFAMGICFAEADNPLAAACCEQALTALKRLNIPITTRKKDPDYITLRKKELQSGVHRKPFTLVFAQCFPEICKENIVLTLAEILLKTGEAPRAKRVLENLVGPEFDEIKRKMLR